VSTSKQLKKTESEKPENPDNSALCIDPNSPSPSLADIVTILQEIRNSINKISSEITLIRTAVEDHSNQVTALRHCTSELKDSIHNIRGFNRKLVSATSDFKKDMYEYLDFPSHLPSPSISTLYSIADSPLRISFRLVLEKLAIH